MSDNRPTTPVPAGAPDHDTGTLKGTCADTLGLVVAPTTGRFEPSEVRGRVRAGELLGHITGGRGRADEVRAPVDAWIKDLLVRPRQLVRRGQALAWLEVATA